MKITKTILKFAAKQSIDEGRVPVKKRGFTLRLSLAITVSCL